MSRRRQGLLLSGYPAAPPSAGRVLTLPAAGSAQLGAVAFHSAAAAAPLPPLPAAAASDISHVVDNR
eukprot:1715641-Pyramimonas_sp.AAC.1